MSYFSDRERGPRPRIKEDINAATWGGIVTLIENLANNSYFGADFPYLCGDGYGVAGNDLRSIALAIRAEIPDLNWPEQMDSLIRRIDLQHPPTLAILDLIEFCYRIVAKPIQGNYHPFFAHYHLEFNREEGRAEFLEKINRILGRNELSYELLESGDIVRLAPPVLQETLAAATFQTGDKHLDELLESARSKYLDPDPKVRRESLEKLWDAWERTKTLEDPADKKKSVSMILDKASAEPHFRERLDREAKELTEIGNNFMIRHTETNKTPIQSSEQTDYLFQRMFALVLLLLRMR